MQSLHLFFRSLAVIFVFSIVGVVGATAAEKISGQDILTNEEVSIGLAVDLTAPASDAAKKGLAVVFLSSTCPCSNSYVNDLQQMSQKYPQIRFVGVHSNYDESKEAAKEYFKSIKIGFPVIQDVGAKIADQLKAYKTPHVFLFNSAGEIVYQGGVSDSNEASRAKIHYLADAIEDLAAARKVRLAQGRTLGCVISRENEKNVW